jgi:hypothetical protein
MTTRNEGVRLRPFLGLDELQALINEFSFLRIQTEAKTEEIQSVYPIEVFPKNVPTAGLTWVFQGELKKLFSALVPAKLSPKDVVLVVRISDRRVGILRESELVIELPLEDFAGFIDIRNLKGELLSRVLGNQWTGFRLDVLLVLGNDRPVSHLYPWMRGTILAQDGFEIVPVSEWDSIQPIELTTELRQTLKLKSNIWCHVEFNEDFFESQEMSESLVFYVDKEILANIKALPENFSLTGQAVLASALLPQVVYKASLELNRLDESFIWDGTSGVILRFLHRSFDPNKKSQEFINLLSDSPDIVVSTLLANHNLGSRLKMMFNSIAEGVEDVSNSLNSDR